MKAVIFGNTLRNEVALYSYNLLEALNRHNVEVLMERDFLVFLRECGYDAEQYVNERNLIDYRDYDADFAFSVGGDGTFIHSTHDSYDRC